MQSQTEAEKTVGFRTQLRTGKTWIFAPKTSGGEIATRPRSPS